MNSETDWPPYLMSRAIAQPPTSCFVIDGSTPVVAFGNPVHAQVATLGINPSSNEFLNRRGDLLVGKQRRLTTLESLDVKDRTALDVGHGRAILDGCADYFNVRSYYWFKALNHILAESIGASYGTTACHLDLVQWATKPVWRDLDAIVRSKLLDDGTDFLVSQLEREQYRLIIVNGRTVMKTVDAAGITSWKSVGTALQDPTTGLYVGESGNQRFLGWSCNLQSQPGARRHIGALIDFVKEHAGFSFLPGGSERKGALL
jgi:hypothetical protein